MVEIKTEQDIINAFKTAAQTKQILTQSETLSPIVLRKDIETMCYVYKHLLPKIPDIRTRKIVWLRAQGYCWKNVAKNVDMTDRNARRIYKKTVSKTLLL